MKRELKNRLQLRVDIEAELAEINGIIRDETSSQLKYKSIEKIVKKIAKEIESSKLNSMLDSRTGLLSAKFGEELLKREVELSKRTGTVFSAALLDIDFLKYINDNYGHVLGTRVIVRVASEIKKAVRGYDILCRYGGDEFLIVFPGAEKDEVDEILKRIRASVLGLRFLKGVKVSLSSGARQYNPKSKISAEEFLDLVDKDLYRNKKSRANVNLKQ